MTLLVWHGISRYVLGVCAGHGDALLVNTIDNSYGVGNDNDDHNDQDGNDALDDNVVDGEACLTQEVE